MTISKWAPNTFTTGQYVGILADFSQCWIADAMSMQVQRLNELYAETNQVGFIGRLETDGAPVTLRSGDLLLLLSGVDLAHTRRRRWYERVA